MCCYGTEMSLNNIPKIDGDTEQILKENNFFVVQEA